MQKWNIFFKHFDNFLRICSDMMDFSELWEASPPLEFASLCSLFFLIGSKSLPSPFPPAFQDNPVWRWWAPVAKSLGFAEKLGMELPTHCRGSTDPLFELNPDPYIRIWWIWNKTWIFSLGSSKSYRFRMFWFLAPIFSRFIYLILKPSNLGKKSSCVDIVTWVPFNVSAYTD